MPLFKLRAGAHTTGAGAEMKFYRAQDPKASIVESDEDLAKLEPARWEPYEGPAPGEEEEAEPEPPPPPPAGDAERAAARDLEYQTAEAKEAAAARLRERADALEAGAAEGGAAEAGGRKRRRHAEE
jgi:hypothetical protein